MSIRTRLLLSFTSITVIAVVTALAGYAAFRSSVDQYRRLAETLVPAHDSIYHMVDLSRELGDEPLAYAFAQTDSDRAQELAAFRQNADALIAMTHQYQETYGMRNGAAIQVAAQTLIDRGGEFIRLIDQKAANEDLQNAKESTLTAEDHFQDLLADGTVNLENELGHNIVAESTNTVAIWTIIAIVCSVLTAIAALYTLIRFITKPIEQLKISAVTMAAGDYSRRVTVARMDEIGELATAFNNMAGAIEKRKLAVIELNQTLEARVVERTEQLRQAKERAEAIFNNTSDAIIVIGEDHVIARTNPAFLRLFGYDETNVTDLTVEQLVADDQRDSLLNALHQATTEQRTTPVELCCRRRDGTEIMVDAAFGVIGTNAYDVYSQHIVGGFHDITAQKQAQAELQETLRKERELSAMKSGFVSLVSHEFRTPLAVIQSSTDLMKRYWDRLAEAKRQEKLSEIQTQIDVMIGYLEDFLSVNGSEMVGAKFAPVRTDVFQFSHDLLDELQRAMNTQAISLSTRGTTAEAELDPKLLRQILVNLLTNAMKYSAPNAPVEVEVVGTSEEITLWVRDHGIGIPEEDQKHIFSPFHRGTNVENISGTGLGLAIVKRAVEAHQGSISFQTEVGKGTTFKVVFPADSATERA